MQIKKTIIRLGVISTCLYFSFYLLPTPDINNFPIVELVSLLLVAALFGVSIIGLITVFKNRKKLNFFEKIIPLAGALLYLSTIALDTYGPPAIDMEIIYKGKYPKMNIDVYFGWMGHGFQLKNNESWSAEYDRPSKELMISWGPNFENKAEKIFDLSKELPRYGSSRKIKIFVTENNIEYKVTKQ